MEVASVSARINGWVSSTKAEISAAIVGIGLVPERLAVEVMTDSQDLVQGFNRYVEGLQGGPI